MTDLRREMEFFRDETVARSLVPADGRSSGAGWMACPECEGQGWVDCTQVDDMEPPCSVCDGTGSLCDVCGQSPAPDGSTRCMCHY